MATKKSSAKKAKKVEDGAFGPRQAYKRTEVGPAVTAALADSVEARAGGST